MGGGGEGFSYGLLGPLTVTSGLRPVQVGGPKQRCILVQLLTSANQPLSIDRIADQLWDGDPPRSAAGTVRTYVRNLRSVLAHASAGDVPLVTANGGYMLRAEPDQIDAFAFEDLHRRARSIQQHDSHKALVILEEGLSLWRGEALSEFSHQAFAQAHAARLNAARVAALAQRAEILLGLGEHVAVVADLEQLVVDHPFDELFQGQLMLALYRSGRAGEALRVYEKYRRRLGEQLGLEPSPPLRALESAIIRQDRDIDWTAESGKTQLLPVAEDNSPGIDRFVGRTEQLRYLGGLLHQSRQGLGALILVSGESGIGKTRLIQELGTRAEHEGIALHWGRCIPNEGAPSFWPWTKALLSAASRLPSALLEAPELRQPLREVSKIAPDFARYLDQGPGDPAVSAPEEGIQVARRFQIIESLATTAKAIAGHGPLVVVLDDLQWADEPSLLFLRHLVHEIVHSPVAVIATYRSEERDHRPEFNQVLAAVGTLPQTTSVHLEGLREPDVAHLIRNATGLDPGPFAPAVHASTAGNALFVREVVRLLSDQAQLVAPDPSRLWELRMPSHVSQVIDSRLDIMTTEANRFLSVASVIGREFSAPLVASVMGRETRALLSPIEESVRAGIVVEDPARPGGFHFRHDLIRQVVYGRMTTITRAHIHGDIAAALVASLATEHALPADPRVEELAHHAYQAILGGCDVELAPSWLARAGHQANTTLAYEKAAAYFTQALEVLRSTSSGTNAEECQILLGLGETYWRLGNSESARTAFWNGVQLARGDADPRLFAMATIGYGGDRFANFPMSSLQLASRLIGLLEEAIERVQGIDDVLQAKLLGRLARELGWIGHVRQADARCRQASALADRIGQPALVAETLHNRFLAMSAPEYISDREAAVTSMLSLSDDMGSVELRRYGSHHHISCLIEQGRMEEAKEALAAYEGLAKELHWPVDRWLIKLLNAQFRLVAGEWVEAESLAHDALTVGLGTQNRETAHAFFHAQLSCIFFDTADDGRLEDLTKSIYQQIESRRAQANRADPIENFTVLNVQSTLCLAEVRIGNLSTARERLFRLASDGAAGIPRNMLWLYHLARFSEAAVELGETAIAKELRDSTLPFAGHNAVLRWAISLGPMGRFVARLAAFLGDRDQAREVYSATIESCRDMGAVPALAHSLWGLAGVLSHDPSTGERRRARELAEEATCIARALGMHRLLDEIGKGDL